MLRELFFCFQVLDSTGYLFFFILCLLPSSYNLVLLFILSFICKILVWYIAFFLIFWFRSCFRYSNKIKLFTISFFFICILKLIAIFIFFWSLLIFFYYYKITLVSFFWLSFFLLNYFLIFFSFWNAYCMNDFPISYLIFYSISVLIFNHGFLFL